MRFSFFFIAVTALAGACGGIAIIDPEPDDEGGGGTSASTSTTTTTPGVTVTTSGVGPGPFSITIGQALGSADCMPVTPPDPLSYVFTLFVDNSQNSLALQVDVLSATLTGSAGTTTFDVEALGPGLVAAGTTAELDFQKVPGSASGTDGCAFCGATDTMLVLEAVAGGMPVEISSFAGSLSCAF